MGSGPSFENEVTESFILQVEQFSSSRLNKELSLGIMKEIFSFLNIDPYMRVAVRWFTSWSPVAMAAARAESGDRTIECGGRDESSNFLCCTCRSP